MTPEEIAAIEARMVSNFPARTAMRYSQTAISTIQPMGHRPLSTP